VIERELRAGLDHAVATEPPLAFDPDALVARAQREHRRRRSLAGVGVATAVIAVAAVAVPTVLNVDSGPARINTADGLTTTPAPPSLSPGQWPPVAVRQQAYSLDQLHARTQAWTKQLQRDLPHVLPQAGGVAVQPWGGEAEGDISAGQGYLDTFVTFTLHGKQTALFIQIEEPGYHHSAPSADCAQPPGTHCWTTWQAGGALVEQATAVKQPDQKLNSMTMRHYRADGTVVSVTTYNYDPTSPAKSAPTAAASLTVAQLTTLATDPVFAF
jgi:hypothetical protein